MTNYLSPKLDVVFKLIFGDVLNADILGDFLLSVLDIPASEIQEITLLDPHIRPDSPDEKKGILDVKVALKSGHRVNVELQMENIPEMVPRLHYYKARMVTEQLAIGVHYKTLVPTSCVAILDYQMYEDEHCHHSFRFYDKQHDMAFSEHEDIHILEIPKLNREKNAALANWLRFLNTTKKEEFDMLAERSEPMKKAVGILANLSADESARMIAEAREKELRDRMSREFGAEERGMKRGVEKGLEKGIEKGKMEVARNLIKMGLPAVDIAKATGLDMPEIEKLKQ